MPRTVEIDRTLGELLKRVPGVSEGMHVSVPDAVEIPTIASLRNMDVRVGWNFSLDRLLVPLVSEPMPCSLYAYQETGIAWLERTTRALLADDMGLGKTVQAIVALRRLIWRRLAFNCLVVTTTSLALNWLAEFARWAPDLAVTVVRPPLEGASATWRLRVGQAHVHVTTFEHLRNFDESLRDAFDIVIVDEAQRVKNAQSKQSRGLAALRPTYLWLLSGTPLERDPADFLTLLALLDKQRFSPSMVGLAPEYVRAIARPFVLRRRKIDVLEQLPRKTYVHEILELLPQQQHEYRSVLRDSAGNDILSRYGRLRAICDVASDGVSAKLDRLSEIVEKIRSQGESVVIFSFWLEILYSAHGAALTSSEKDVFLLDSSMNAIERQLVVEAFQARGGVLFAGGHIAGEGLTLTRANNVVLLNRWWNPSKNVQVEDRVCRIGQNLPVSVYTFTMSGTVEEAVDEMLLLKSDAHEVFVELLAARMPSR